MPTEPDRPRSAAPAPAEPDPAPGRALPSAPRPRRRGPRRATGGTFTGAEPHLSGLDGRAPGTDEEAAEGSGERAHEEWLRAQRPPHWD